MQFRNAQSLGDGRFDCEIEHPVHGWIPYTLDPADTDKTVDNVSLRAAIGTDFQAHVAPNPAIALAQARAAVNAERDRRLGTTFAFAGKSYDCDKASLARITGAATLAGFAMGAGAEADDLRWHGGKADFTWIAADNSLTTMDAQTCFAFGNAAATNESAHIFAGHAIKAMDPIPADFTNDKYWP